MCFLIIFKAFTWVNSYENLYFQDAEVTMVTRTQPVQCSWDVCKCSFQETLKISANFTLSFVKQRVMLIRNLCKGSDQFSSLWELVMIEKLARAGPSLRNYIQDTNLTFRMIIA